MSDHTPSSVSLLPNPSVRKRQSKPLELGGSILQRNPRITPEEEQVLVQARTILLKLSGRAGEALGASGAVREYLIALLSHQERECFVLILLDTRHRVLVSEILFVGTIDGANVYPREVVKCALRHNAAAAVIAHNHPSAVAEPSAADEYVTRRLKDALALVDIRLLDHFVVAGASAYSFAEAGLL